MRRNGKDVFKSVFMKDKRCWHKTGPLRGLSNKDFGRK